MDKREALEILRTYALDGVYDDNGSEASARAEARIDEAYETLDEGLISNEYVADEQDDETLNELLQIYGSEENILNLRPMTHEESYIAHREKILGYITAWPDDNRQSRWQRELEELDDWYAKISNDGE